MKRTLTLVAFIISTVFLAVDLILELISIPALIALFGAIGGGNIVVALYAIIGLLIIILLVVALIVNAVAITKWNKSAEVYAAKKGSLIGAIVLNFIISVLLIVMMIISGVVGAMSIILMIALIAANVLALVDMKFEEKRVAATAQVATEETAE